ncbi:CARDB domain-containing protein [Bythopirellula goksoeyrii]|uniref:Large cysteine-rich periplasmic protein OmcB n=1 Tax=Bythopirellula goksoeyrii TaxID=1400387 RepID=A0A5B9QRQ5_9BACT|nr:CARDB domain-containing protein [Bythopirellula goksoeyrii]QEG36663.1 Large cysteine-rich periplasmic protein OmcB precursor [Bythopirellula goksoeyrii]
MTRRLITGIVLVAMLIGTPTTIHAQPVPNRSGGTTLVDRLSQLKSVFVRDQSSKNESANGSSSNRSSTNRTARMPNRSASQGRVQQGDLLPKGIFDRNADPGHRGNEYELGDEVFDTSPRRGSNTGNQGSLSNTRSSPSTTRENELQEALEDLLATDLDGSGNEIEDLDSDDGFNRLPSDSEDFDLRKALINKSKGGSAQTSTSNAIEDLRQQLEALEQQKVYTPPTESRNRARKATSDRDAERVFTGVSQPATQPSSRVASNIPSKSSNMLLSSKQPMIGSRVEGPRQILVGREATYRVILENASDTAAKDLSAEVGIPEWAEVVEVTSTSGVVQQQSSTQGSETLKWQLQDLAGRSKQSLLVKLIPRSGKPLNISVQWTVAPIATQTIVEVQEPKLEMTLGGPEEVYYNKAQRYQLSLRNPGTGDAENVVVRLVPPGGDEQSASSHSIGNLPAGSSKEIELELTARESGQLVMKATATAAGGLQSEAVKPVLCLKPEIEVDWRGSEEKYAGTEASYYFRIRNPGTADTEPVTVQVKLPSGAKLASASDGYRHDALSGILSWQLPGIKAGDAQFLQIRCEVARAGTNRFVLNAQTAGGGLSATKEIETNVIAIADLKLAVSDPKGPVPVGENAIYEIRIRNRGTTDAQNVGVVGLFSEGIDPTAVEGAQFSVRDGRVSIHPINSLPAGEELVLRIRATASREGTHVFRAEVTCQDLDIKLAAEETTKFYEDQFRWEDSKTAYSSDQEQTITR